jgi:hypothetical protein
MKQGKRIKISNQDLLEELEKTPGVSSEDKLFIQKLENEANQ